MFIVVNVCRGQSEGRRSCGEPHHDFPLERAAARHEVVGLVQGLDEVAPHGGAVAVGARVRDNDASLARRPQKARHLRLDFGELRHVLRAVVLPQAALLAEEVRLHVDQHERGVATV